MEKLTKIQNQLVEIIEYFETIAKSIHPEMERGDILNKAVSLTQEWLDVETSKAVKSFFDKKGIKIYG